MENIQEIKRSSLPRDLLVRAERALSNLTAGMVANAQYGDKDVKVPVIKIPVEKFSEALDTQAALAHFLKTGVMPSRR